LLTNVLPTLHGHVVVVRDFAQLARETLRVCEPMLETLLEALRSRAAKRMQIGFDRQVVAHGVALQRAADAAHQVWRIVFVLDPGEAHLVPAPRGEIDTGCEARQEALCV